eukprot:COSAG03_NODE_7103_length_962_cov_2.337196_1_plen_153_part_10
MLLHIALVSIEVAETSSVAESTPSSRGVSGTAPGGCSVPATASPRGAREFAAPGGLMATIVDGAEREVVNDPHSTPARTVSTSNTPHCRPRARRSYCLIATSSGGEISTRRESCSGRQTTKLRTTAGLRSCSNSQDIASSRCHLRSTKSGQHY